MECGHIYNHNSCDNLRCIKCNNIICKLSKKGHLCGGQHDCPKECEADGCCEIESFVQQEVETYKSEFGEEIQYHTIKLQEIKKKQCICKIPMNEFSHKKNIHICGGKFINVDSSALNANIVALNLMVILACIDAYMEILKIHIFQF